MHAVDVSGLLMLASSTILFHTHTLQMCVQDGLKVINNQHSAYQRVLPKATSMVKTLEIIHSLFRYLTCKFKLLIAEKSVVCTASRIATPTTTCSKSTTSSALIHPNLPFTHLSLLILLSNRVFIYINLTFHTNVKKFYQALRDTWRELVNYQGLKKCYLYYC